MVKALHPTWSIISASLNKPSATETQSFLQFRPVH